MSTTKKSFKISQDSTDSSEFESPSKKKPRLKKCHRMKQICFYAIFGYTFGILITGLCFSVMTGTYKVSVIKAAWTCAIFGIFATLGFTYNKSLRCNMVLIVPIICSVKGRSFLVAYAFLLTATGPAYNITKNIQVLSKSLSCGQEQLKEAIKKILEIIKSPLIAIKNAIRIAIDELKNVLKQIEIVFKEVVKVLKKILNTIKKVFSWLGGRGSICDKELGNPFERCIKMANDTINDCEDAMKSLKALCHVTKIFNGLCYTLKLFDVFCKFKQFVSDAIIGEVMKKMKEFQEALRKIFDASVKFDHDFHFATNKSKNWTDVGNDIMADVRKELSNFFIILGWGEFLALFMFCRLILKSMYYKYKYLKSNSFDNYFVTREFKEVDKRRKRTNKELALPLTRKEKRRYVTISSLTLMRSEILKMARSVMFLLISTIQIVVVCLIDYSLFYILATMRKVGYQEEPLDSPQFVGVDVDGTGFLANIYKGIISAFKPLAAKYEMDPKPCLPNPSNISFKRYSKIGAVMVLVWMFLFAEPYVLRLRQIIMRSFYPDRAKERAVWLYNQVLLKRTSFIKLARRQARSKILKDSTATQISCMDWIRAKTNRWYICKKILGEGKGSYCILCASYLTGKNLVKCMTPQCTGVYCSECYRESDNMCCLCKSPIEYGDESDLSEEVDSEELGEIKVNKYCP